MKLRNINDVIAIDGEIIPWTDAETAITCPICGSIQTHMSIVQINKKPLKCAAKVVMSCDDGHHWNIVFTQDEDVTLVSVESE